MSFSEKLRELMRRRRLSQVELAASAGVHQTQVSKWARGIGAPDIYQGLALARRLGVPLDALADDAGRLPADGDSAEALAVETVRSLGLSRADVIRAFYGAEPRREVSEDTAEVHDATRRRQA